VALLAASAVMAEAIPPCINLIILGFVANLSIGGLFVAGLLPAGLMAVALIVLSIILGKRPEPAAEAEPRAAVSGLWSGAIASFGLIFMIFFGFKSGFATATEISAFAVVYAIIVGSIVFRELSFRTAAHSFVQSSPPRNRWPSCSRCSRCRMPSATSCCRSRRRRARGCSCCCRSRC
jgi:TRAP-type C4-dicarboxylate transport system permease large subunit